MRHRDRCARAGDTDRTRSGAGRVEPHERVAAGHRSGVADPAVAATDPARDSVAARAKALLQSELLAVSDDICTHPEIGYKERRSVEKLAEVLRAHQFDVTIGAAGFDTAFVARYKQNNGAPQLGVIVEYDALRGTEGPFHGDQHCAQGPIGIAAAVAVAEFLTRTGCREVSPCSAHRPRSCSSRRLKR